MPPSNNMQPPVAPHDLNAATGHNQLHNDDDLLGSTLVAALNSGSAAAPSNNYNNSGNVGSGNTTALPTSTAPDDTHSGSKTSTGPEPPKTLFVVHPRVFKGKLASSVPRSAFFDFQNAVNYAQGVFHSYCRRTYFDCVYRGPTELKRGGVVRFTARDAKTGERLMLVDVFSVNVLDVHDWWAKLHAPEPEINEDAEEEEEEEEDGEEMGDEVEDGDDDDDDIEMEKEEVEDDNDEDEQHMYMAEDEESQEEWLSDGEGSGMEETEDMKVFRGRV